MRKSILFTFAVILLLSLSGCGKSKKPTSISDVISEQPQLNMEMSSQDSVEVYSLVNQYLDKLRDGKIDEAVGMIYALDTKEQIAALPPNLVRMETALLTRFKGVRYDLDRIAYDRETDNIAKYTVTLFDKDDSDPRPNKISFVLKPIRRDGKWYLTMADTQSGNGTNLPN